MRKEQRSCPRNSTVELRERSGVLGPFVAALVVVATISLSSCAGYTTNASAGNGSGAGASGGGVLTASPASISFANLAVGSTSTQTITVTNTGTGTATISGASISGGVFTVVGGNPSSSLAVGQSATLQIQFAPTSMTPATGTLTVSSNATNSTLNVGLSGTGLEAVAGFSPSSLNFNNVTVGQSSTQSVTVGNSGNMNLSVSAVAVSGTGFSLSGFSAPATIAPNQTATFNVQFAPTTTNGGTGSVLFTDNGQNGSQSFSMTGSAVAAGGTLGANPGSFNFNSVAVGSSSTQAITLTNSGASTITINSVTASGSGYSQTGIAAQQTIAAGASATMTARFAPTTTGNATGSISINSNATNSPLVVSLSGTGIQGALSANPASISFGSILIGNSSSVNVTLTNSGTASLTINGASASGTGFSMSALASQTLTAGQTATFTATFAPTASGNASGTVSVTSSAPNSPLVINLSGSGVTTQAQLGISPSSVNFNNVNVGSNSSQTITLNNTGNATLNISAATINGTGYTMSLTPTSINAGSSTTFSVTFTPTTGGSASGTISITSNAPNSPATIAVSGTGLQAQISSNPTSFAFGTVANGTTDSQQITLHNGGNTTLSFSQITVNGAGFGQTGLTTSTTVAAGASTTFNATFDPSASGSVTGSIVLATNGSPSSLTINLSGTGQAPTFLLGANPGSLSFGNTMDQSNASLTALLTNNGNSNVTISNITTTGAGFTSSGVANGTALTPGQSATLTVEFAPTSGGPVSGANVSIASNATGSPTTISLSGTGVHSVVLAWGASPTNGASYNVFRGTTSGGEGTTPINPTPVSALTYTDTNVTPGTNYFYTVEAVNSGGSSAPSSEAVADVPNP